MPHDGVEVGHSFIAGAIIEVPTFDRGQGRERFGQRFRLEHDVVEAWPAARSGQPYADQIARQFQLIYGIDLRHTVLGTHGFQPKA